MSFAYGFGLPHWQPLSGGFSPAGLFQAGVIGTFYDPSDPTTLFTTSTGTTPCAVPGSGSQVLVGLMLDKSQGAPGALGAELFGTFGTVTAPWTAQGGGVWSIDGSQAGSRDLSQALQYTIGRFYVTRFTLSGVTGGSVNVFAGEGAVGPAYGNGTFTIRSYSSQAYLIFRAPAGVSATVSGISVREIPGNHAIAFNDTTARPELSARVNLLTYSEQFDNGAWVKTAASVGINAATAPDGTLTADALIEDATNARHATYQSASLSLVTPFVASVYVKANTRTYALFGVGNSRFTRCIVNLSTGVAGALIGSEAANLIATVSSVGNGWWRVVIAGAFSTADSGFLWVGASDGSEIYTGNGTSGIFIWGADLRPANIGANVPAYQRIADANTYDTSGFPLYLRFDGVDDSMYTPASINFSGTDKMSVFAGVRKLSDAATSVITELSVDKNSNNGVFLLNTEAAPRWYWESKGTLIGAINSGAVTTFAAPITSVVTGIGDISGDSSIIRVNSSQLGSSASDQGTGNYGSYPLFIGSRNNASLRFNGHLYSLIIAGTQLQSGSITATEQYVAGKTGVQI